MSKPFSFDEAKNPATAFSFEEASGAQQSFSFEEATQEKSYGKALLRAPVEGTRESVGGMMEAAGTIVPAPTMPQIMEPIFRQGPMGIPKALMLGQEAVKKHTAEFINGPEKQTDFEKTLQGAGQELSADARAQMKEVTPDNLNVFQDAGLSVAQSLPPVLGGLAANRFGARTGVTTAGVLGTFGATTFGSTYSRARAKGADPRTALETAALDAGIEVGTELTGLQTLLKGGEGWFKRFLLQELGGEEVATIGQSLNEKANVDPEKWSSFNEIGRDLVVTGLAAAGTTGIVGGVHKSLELTRKKDRQSAADAGKAAQAEMELLLKQAQEAEAQQTGTVIPNYSPRQSAEVLSTPLTPEMRAEAEVLKEQMNQGEAWPTSPQGEAFGARLEANFQQLFAEDQNRNLVDPKDLEDTGGISDAVEARRSRMEATTVDHSERPYVAATDPKVIGLNTKQAPPLTAGFVGAIRVNEELAPQEYAESVVTTIKQLVDKYAPGMTVLVNFDAFAPKSNAFGLHQRVNINGKSIHVITPREMPSLGQPGYGNAHTKMAMTYALAHEFGHAVTRHHLEQDMVNALGAEAAAAIMDQVDSREGLTPEHIAALQASPSSIGSLMLTWNSMRERVMTGEMPASEFVDTWAGVRKLGDSVLKGKGGWDLHEWGRKYAKRAGVAWESMTALQLAQEVWGGDWRTNLSFDEFMAEQMSRHAYQSGDIDRSPLGQWFKNILGRLRQMFVDLKKEGVIPPRTEFTTWIEEKAATARSQKKNSKLALPKAVSEKRNALLAKKLAEIQGVMPVASAEELAAKETKKKFKEKTAAKRKADPKRPVKEVVVEAQEEAEAEVAEQVVQAQEAVRQELAPVDETPIEASETPPYEALSEVEQKEFLLQKLAEVIDYGVWTDSKLIDANRARITKLVQEGQLEKAREALERAFTKSGHAMFDREYTTKLLEKVKDKKQITEQYIRTLLNAGGLAKKDRALLLEMKRFAATQNITPEDLREVIERRMLPLQLMPLDYIQIAGKDTKFPAHFGTDRLWYSEAAGDWVDPGFDPLIKAHVWTGEDLVLPGNPHFHEVTNYIAHTRVIENMPWKDKNALAWAIFEVQSDLLQGKQPFNDRSPETYKAFEGTLRELSEEFPAYWERLLQEETWAALQAGRKYVALAGPETLFKAQGWPDPVPAAGQQQYHAGLRGYHDGMGRAISGQVRVSPVYGGQFEVETVVGSWALVTPMMPGMARAIINNLTWEQDLGENQVIYDRYQNELVPFVQKTYGAEEFQDEAGNTWYGWETSKGEKAQIVAWDREGPSIPFAQPAQEHLRSAVMADARGEPLVFWHSTAGERTDLPQGGADSSAFWLYANWLNAGRPNGTLQGYWAQVSNPLVIDALGLGYNDSWDQAALDAQAQGHDAVLVENVGLGGSALAVLDRNKLYALNDWKKAPEDEIFWDRQQPAQANSAAIAGRMKGWMQTGWMATANRIAKSIDAMVQLQQRAGTHGWNDALQAFLRYTQEAESLKNKLMYLGEETMGQLQRLSPEVSEKVRKFLYQEWKSEGHSTHLVGLDDAGDIVWQGGVGDRNAVMRWEHRTSANFEILLAQNGIDPNSEQGKGLVNIILGYKNSILTQLDALEIALQEGNYAKFGSNRQVLQVENTQLRETMDALRARAFVPQGRFGKHVLVLKEKLWNEERGQWRYTNIHVQHFESQVAFQKAEDAMRKDLGGDVGTGKRYQIQTKVIEDYQGIPMMLPLDLLDRLRDVGGFTKDQLTLMEEMMHPSRLDKISQRYLDKIQNMPGASEDWVRSYADFIWHNANFIWKLQYRRKFSQALSLARTRRTAAEREVGGDPVATRKAVELWRRDEGLMLRTRDYLLNPPDEFQGVRFWTTMVYLAANVKTAVLNLSTSMHTIFAAGAEYGDAKAMKAFSNAVWELAHLRSLSKRIENARNDQERARLSELNNLLSKAEEEGVIDQSFAYMLAGTANGLEVMRRFRSTKAGWVASRAAEASMLPFRWTEKANRLISLITFYNLERQTLSPKGGKTPTLEAYQIAVQKTNMLQGAYDSANRPEWLRGGKGLASVRPLITIFLSYAQMMSWLSTGGYDRAMRSAIAERNTQAAINDLDNAFSPRALPHKANTMALRLWLFYLLMGGLWGMPFARNLMDIIQALTRGLTGRNAETMVRQTMQEIFGDSDLPLKGLMGNVFGFDLSASFGIGRLIPMTDMLNKNFRDVESTVGRLGVGMAGAAGGLFLHLLQAAGEWGEGKVLEGFKKLPGEMGALAKTLDAVERQNLKPGFGVVKSNGESLVVEDGRPRDLTYGELVGMALGAQTAVVSQNREREYAVAAEQIYWQGRRANLRKRVSEARMKQDEVELKDALESVKSFNEDLPSDREHQNLRITGKELRQSWMARKRQQKLDTRYNAQEKKYRALADETNQSFGESN